MACVLKDVIPAFAFAFPAEAGTHLPTINNRTLTRCRLSLI